MGSEQAETNAGGEFFRKGRGQMEEYGYWHQTKEKECLSGDMDFTRWSVSIVNPRQNASL